MLKTIIKLIVIIIIIIFVMEKSFADVSKGIYRSEAGTVLVVMDYDSKLEHRGKDGRFMPGFYADMKIKTTQNSNFRNVLIKYDIYGPWFNLIKSDKIIVRNMVPNQILDKKERIVSNPAAYRIKITEIKIKDSYYKDETGIVKKTAWTSIYANEGGTVVKNKYRK